MSMEVATETSPIDKLETQDSLEKPMVTRENGVRILKLRNGDTFELQEFNEDVFQGSWY
jgi:hypothetical protein